MHILKIINDLIRDQIIRDNLNINEILFSGIVNPGITLEGFEK